MENNIKNNIKIFSYGRYETNYKYRYYGYYN